jgi:hypothetical protein
MRKIPAMFVLGGVFLCSGQAATLSRQVVSYDIKAQLSPETKTVEGWEVLTWLNDSDVPVKELRFHLYLNAFKNNQTTFAKEAGGMPRDFDPDSENWGSIAIREIGVLGGADLKPSMAFLRPDDGNAGDETVMKVELPAPVKPGKKIALVLSFSSKLPKVVARSGFSGDFYMVAQWFPKVGVFQNGEWNCHQYHAWSEFFADFGSYHVEITVPAKYIVGATGKRVAERVNADGTKTYIHHQEDVHDFAWAACPDFVEFHEPFAQDEPRVSTDMILLVHRTHLGQKDRYARALRNAIEFYSKSYGAYPYETITLVDPAPGASRAEGMEYPTLFTAMTTSWMPRGRLLPEETVVHEFGHNYWYGMVASNEFEEAWLDEGINTYSEIKAMARYYGEDRSFFNLGGIRVSDLAVQRFSVMATECFDPVVKNSWDFLNGDSYGRNVYAKAGLVLLMLEKWLGEDIMDRVMRTYFERWKFRHPTSKDFVQVAEEVSGQDLGWFFGPGLYGTNKLDYAVSDLNVEEVAAPEGVFGDSGALEGRPAKADRRTPARPKAYRNMVTAARYGDWIFPVDVLITFDNGEKIREFWDGRDRWKRFVYVKNTKVISAEIDPDHKLVLDLNTTNNSRSLDQKRPAVVRATLGFLTWFQALLSLITL